jgi:hypothetical protein
MTGGGVKLKCVTTSITQILNITGHYVQMHRIGTQNTYSSANNVCDVKVAARNFYAKNCSFRGGTGAAQIGAAHSGIPLVVDLGQADGIGGNAMLIEDCVIGSSGNTIRTAGTGCFEVYSASPVGGGFGMEFRNCKFSLYSATAAVVACSVGGTISFDRELLFQNCKFFAFNDMSTNLNNVFDMTTGGATGNGWVYLHNCSMMGFDYWATAGSHMYVSCGPANVGVGGKTVVVANS